MIADHYTSKVAEAGSGPPIKVKLIPECRGGGAFPSRTELQLVMPGRTRTNFCKLSRLLREEDMTGQQSDRKSLVDYQGRAQQLPSASSEKTRLQNVQTL